MSLVVVVDVGINVDVEAVAFDELIAAAKDSLALKPAAEGIPSER
jgi:hypothetical protein